MTRLDLYVNFVLHAVYGKLSEADALMRTVGHEITHVAAALARMAPFEPMPIYRGMLLDPSKPFELDPRLMFLSWSEDRDVASWFACPQSVISEPLTADDPSLRGYLSAWAVPERVLFHYSWVKLFGGVDAIAELALRHPFMGAEGHRQIKWSLSTQREVITAPLPISPRPVDDLDNDARVALDRRLAPSWVAVQP